MRSSSARGLDGAVAVRAELGPAGVVSGLGESLLVLTLTVGTADQAEVQDQGQPARCGVGAEGLAGEWLGLLIAEIGRDPASVTRSIHLPVSYDRPGSTRDAMGEAVDAGFGHIVLGLPAPYPAEVARGVTDARWVTDAWWVTMSSSPRRPEPSPAAPRGPAGV
ncbi:hypothetical protein ABB07_02010 [Streptomyces incarnatus]|uniref:Uncharacterized protein n=1 Tax=Streptomyces incarnatus TaxID=665007 RepID=A0ABM5TD49_9ACTN|nr:hypothetical protein ABB07_02010 [Streptomyces incarnatus]